MDMKDIFSKRLCDLRGTKGKEYTRQRVANDLGISRASLEYYEKGQRLPDIEIAAKIADYYGVSVDYLLGRTKNTTTIKKKIDVCEYIGLSEIAVDNIKRLSSYYNDDIDFTFQKNITAPYGGTGFSEEDKQNLEALENVNKTYNYYFDLCCKNSDIILHICDFLCICNKYVTYYADTTRFDDDFIRMKYYNLFMHIWYYIPDMVEDMYYYDLDKGKELTNKKAGD